MTLAFLDLETTGLDLLVETHCPILEVAIVLTDDNLVPFAERSLLVEPREDGNGTIVAEFADLCEPEAFRMHEASGLLREIDQRQPGPIEMTQEALLDFLAQYGTEFTAPGTVPLVGFGVGRFDVPLLARWMPELLSRFHYRTIDVRTLTEVTRRWADFGGAPTERRTHRALADCKDALAVLQWWRGRYMPDRSGAMPAAPHQQLAADMRALRDSTPIPGRLEMHVDPPVLPGATPAAPHPYLGSQRDAADRNYG